LIAGWYYFYTTDNEAVRIREILQPSPKPLDEVRGNVISDYQNILEKEWQANIRNNISIWVDYDKILSWIKK